MNSRKKFDLPIREVVAGGDIEKEAYAGEGEHVNSDFLEWFEERGSHPKDDCMA